MKSGRAVISSNVDFASPTIGQVYVRPENTWTIGKQAEQTNQIYNYDINYINRSAYYRPPHRASLVEEPIYADRCDGDLNLTHEYADSISRCCGQCRNYHCHSCFSCVFRVTPRSRAECQNDNELYVRRHYPRGQYYSATEDPIYLSQRRSSLSYIPYTSSSDNNLNRSDQDFRCTVHHSRFSLLRSRPKGRRPTSAYKKQLDNSRLSRSLDDLPGDIRDHILRCQCSCDHLGYGNYSSLSLEAISSNSWANQIPTQGRLHWENKAEPAIAYKQREMEVRNHLIAALCLILMLAGVAGVGVSLPLALKAESSADNEKRLQAAKALLSETPLVDGHNDLPWNIRKFMHNRLHSFNMTADLSNLRPWSKSSWSHTDLPRLRKGHVGAQFWVAYIPCEAQYLNAVQLAIEQIDLIKRLIEQYPDDLELARNSEDIERIFNEGRISSLIGVEGGHAIQNSLGVLRALHELGVRYMTLTHTCSTPWAECARNKESDIEDPTAPRGLTDFGKIVVREMNRLGIMVDLSHVSQETMRSALDISIAPVLFSHSSVYSLCKNPRNVPDDIIKKVKRNGGLIMISFYNHFLTCSGKATISDVISHINHVRKIAGINHVGIGADFDGINKLPTGLEDVSKYPSLFAELLKDPLWSEEDLKKLAGLNLIRLLKKVEDVAVELKDQNMRPQEETVPYSSLRGKDNCSLRFLSDERS